MERRSINEIGKEEKIQIHFEFNDQRKGYAEIARTHMLDNGDIYLIVQEIDNLRNHRNSEPKVRAVLRRVYINKQKKASPIAKPSHQKNKKQAKYKQERQAPVDVHRPVNAAMALAFQQAGVN